MGMYSANFSGLCDKTSSAKIDDITSFMTSLLIFISQSFRPRESLLILEVLCFFGNICSWKVVLYFYTQNTFKDYP